MWVRVLVDHAALVLSRLDAVGVRLPARERGQSMVEYAIVAALIAVVAMAAVQALGGGIAGVFTNILSRIQSIGSS